MAYQVIARKYRPQRFSDVVGQEHVTQTLENAIRQKRIAHAYIFCGPRGTGKTTIARIFAMCLNCTDGPKADLDGNDPRVKEIRDGRSLDVLEIDGASNRGIEEIRELRETVKFAPAASRFKVYIIDEVHMLTKEAFNALLKTLEEPPEHVKFMFATTEPEKVLATILSRCQRFDLRRIPVDLIVEHLGTISKQEKVNIDGAALYAIARGAEGCMRDAESALDQLISFCGEKIAEEDVLSMFGLAGRGQIVGLAAAVLHGQTEQVLRLLDDLSKHGKDLGRLLSDLLNHFRDLMVFQVSKGDWSLIEIPESERATITEQAALVGSDGLTRIMEVLTEAETRFRDASSKKIFIEVALIKAIDARNAISIDTVLQQLNELRGGPDRGTGATARKAAMESPAVATARKPAETKTRMSEHPATTHVVMAPAPAVPITAAETAAEIPRVEDLWARALGAAGMVIRNCLQSARPISFAKDVLTLGLDTEHFDLINQSPTHTELEKKLKELGYANVKVSFIREETVAPVAVLEPAANLQPIQQQPPASAPVVVAQARSAPPPPRAPERLNTEDFKNDPLIQRALEIFKGHIVEVRA
jgi:DNA polymerase-3 subunit gamma/tau